MFSSNNQSYFLKNSKSNVNYNNSDDKNIDTIKENEKEKIKNNNTIISQHRNVGNVKKTQPKIKVSQIDKKNNKENIEYKEKKENIEYKEKKENI